MYLAFKNLKVRTKKSNSALKGQSKVQNIFYEVEMQQDRCRWCSCKLNIKNTTNDLIYDLIKKEVMFPLTYF